jgi:hypothetical protein
MADKIRLVIMADEEIRAALRLEAAEREMEMSELAEEILRDALASALEKVRKRRQADKRKGPQ